MRYVVCWRMRYVVFWRMRYVVCWRMRYVVCWRRDGGEEVKLPVIELPVVELPVAKAAQSGWTSKATIDGVRGAAADLFSTGYCAEGKLMGRVMSCGSAMHMRVKRARK